VLWSRNRLYWTGHDRSSGLQVGGKDDPAPRTHRRLPELDRNVRRHTHQIVPPCSEVGANVAPRPASWDLAAHRR